MKKRVIGFLVISFVIAWAMWIAIYIVGLDLSNNIASWVITLSMFAPAAGVILMKVIDGKPMLMVRFSPLIKGNVTWYLLAIFLPFVLSLLGAMLYFLVFSDQLDLTLSYIRSTYEATMPAGYEIDASVLKIGVISSIVTAVTIGPIINMFFAVGEEIGWRGFLYPALSKKFTPVKSSIIVGIIWGLWYAPIVMMGYNYGTEYTGAPFLGIVAMCLFCFSSGVVYTWFIEKTGSVWTGALANGSLNVGGALGILFINAGAEYNQVLGPQISGIIPTIPVFILAIILLIIKSRSGEEEELEVDEIAHEGSYENIE